MPKTTTSTRRQTQAAGALHKERSRTRSRTKSRTKSSFAWMDPVDKDTPASWTTYRRTRRALKLAAKIAGVAVVTAITPMWAPVLAAPFALTYLKRYYKSKESEPPQEQTHNKRKTVVTKKQRKPTQ